MLGAIFYQEMLVAGRRQRSYFLRWVYAAVLLAQLAPRVIGALFFEAFRPGSSALGAYGRFFESFAAQHFFFLLVLTPALAAGAITDEKMRGTLDYLLTSCLQPAEIVLGKLLSRVTQLLVLALVGLPVVCFFGVIGDLDPGYLLALLAASAVLITGTAALSLLASVWCRQTRDAVLCTYLVLVAAFTLAGLVEAAGWSWPAEALSPWHAVNRDDPGRWARLGQFTLAWLVPAAGCLTLACARLRHAYARQRGGGARPATGRRPWWRRERSPSDNPVLWRERWVQGIAPLARLRAIPLGLAAGAVALSSAATLVGLALWRMPAELDPWDVAGLRDAIREQGADWFLGAVTGQGGVVLLLVTLLAAVRASGGITEEREKQTWDTLLLTPLTTREIVRGKFWGLQAAFIPYFLAYVAGTLPLIVLLCPVGAVITGLFAVAMVITLPWVVAAGLCCSAYLRSSWRSLLATLALCYAASALLASPACVLSCMLSTFVTVMVRELGQAFGAELRDVVMAVAAVSHGGSFLVLFAVIFGPIAYMLLLLAEQRVEKHERAMLTRREVRRQMMHTRLHQLADELDREARAPGDAG
jgi:ABC-type transport system involved in multi-copper enzyme maturation permease subunit